MTNQWERLASAIRLRREHLGLTQVALATLAAVSLTTIQNLEGGRKYTRLPNKISKIEHALGWASGSCADILHGGEPTLLSASDAAPQSDQPTATDDPGARGRTLPVRVRRALDTGEIFDADVISIRGLDLILIAKAGAYTAEDVERALDGNAKDWDLIRELLRDAARESDDPSDQTSNE